MHAVHTSPPTLVCRLICMAVIVILQAPEWYYTVMVTLTELSKVHPQVVYSALTNGWMSH